MGRFDVVLFAGVLYHLRHPFLGLEQVAQLAVSELIVETHVDALDLSRPAMVFYSGDELGGDGSNWWGPNALCVEAMLRDVGLPNIETTLIPESQRGIFRATR